MKKFFFAVLVLCSVSALAQDSEFERGYEAGKLTCKNPQEAWLCSIRLGNYQPVVGSGETKAEAILSMNQFVLEDLINRGAKLNCVQL